GAPLVSGGGGNAAVITTNAHFYATANNGIGTLNALFYGENQGTAAADWGIYIVGGNNQLGPNKTSGGIFNATTGFQIGGAAASAGHVLRANGTNYVDSALAYADLGGKPVGFGEYTFN